jgi:DNA-directed RNA polymerase specialized sigma24 family protein
MSSNQNRRNVTSIFNLPSRNVPSGVSDLAQGVHDATTAAASAPNSAIAADLDKPAPANDNATLERVPDTTRLVAHPDVVRYIRATLRRSGVALQDMDDAIAEVQADAIESARTARMPCDAAQWKALVATIGVRRAIDRLRETEVRGKYDAGLCDDADAHAGPALHVEHRDPVDTKRYLAILKELFDSGQMPEHGAEILQGEADGVSHEELAAELGLSKTVVRNRLFRMRARFRARLAALGMLTEKFKFFRQTKSPPSRLRK